MGKYDELKYLKKTKARVNHHCNQCGVTIVAGDYYYRETEEDRFLQSLLARSFCTKCYEQFGASSLKKGKEKRRTVHNGKITELDSFVLHEHQDFSRTIDFRI